MDKLLEQILGVPVADMHPGFIEYVNARTKNYPIDIDERICAMWIADWRTANDDALIVGWIEHEAELKEQNRQYQLKQRVEARERKRVDLDAREAKLNEEFAEIQADYNARVAAIGDERKRLDEEEAEDSKG